MGGFHKYNRMLRKYGKLSPTQPAGVADPAAAAAITTAALTDNSGGTASGTLADVTEANNVGSADRVPVENALASLAAEHAKVVTDVTALKTAIDANNTAIDAINANLEARLIQAAA